MNGMQGMRFEQSLTELILFILSIPVYFVRWNEDGERLLQNSGC